jgi:hypothetical protein
LEKKHKEWHERHEVEDGYLETHGVEINTKLKGWCIFHACVRIAVFLLLSMNSQRPHMLCSVLLRILHSLVVLALSLSLSLSLADTHMEVTTLCPNLSMVV